MQREMKRIRLITFVLLAMVGSVSLRAQQRSIYSQYMFNGLTINPAHSATDIASNLSIHHRQQWLGMSDAPQTSTLSFYTPTGFSTLSIGAIASYDKIGVNSQAGGTISAAVKIQLSPTMFLGAGLNIGADYGHSDLPSLPTTHDPMFEKAERDLNGVVGAGLMLYSSNFYLGVSAPQLQNISIQEEKSDLREESMFLRHFYVSGGYLWDVSQDFKLKPHFLLRFPEKSQMQYDINLSAYLFNRLWVGASWRSEESINLLFKYEFSPKFELACSYDILTGASSKVAYGSLEVMLSYRFMVQRQHVVPVRGWF